MPCWFCENPGKFFCLKASFSELRHSSRWAFRKNTEYLILKVPSNHSLINRHNQKGPKRKLMNTEAFYQAVVGQIFFFFIKITEFLLINQLTNQCFTDILHPMPGTSETNSRVRGFGEKKPQTIY